MPNDSRNSSSGNGRNRRRPRAPGGGQPVPVPLPLPILPEDSSGSGGDEETARRGGGNPNSSGRNAHAHTAAAENGARTSGGYRRGWGQRQYNRIGAAPYAAQRLRQVSKLFPCRRRPRTPVPPAGRTAVRDGNVPHAVRSTRLEVLSDLVLPQSRH